MATAADVDPLAAFSPRPVCSDDERRLAVWAHDDLRARGHEAWVETHWVRPHVAAGLALGCALCATGGLIAIGAPVAGLVVAAVGALSVLMDASGRAGPLRWLLPRRATQVVLVAPHERAATSRSREATASPDREAPPSRGHEAATSRDHIARDELAAVELLLVP